MRLDEVPAVEACGPAAAVGEGGPGRRRLLDVAKHAVVVRPEGDRADVVGLVAGIPDPELGDVTFGGAHEGTINAAAWLVGGQRVFPTVP